MTNEAKVQATSRQLLQDHLVWDNHACLPMRPDDHTFLPQLEQYRAAGVDVVSLNIGYGSLDLEHHLRMAAAFRRWIHAMIVNSTEIRDVWLGSAPGYPADRIHMVMNGLHTRDHLRPERIEAAARR